MTYSMGQEEFAVNLRKQYIKNKIEKCPNQLQKHDYFRHYIQAVSKTALPNIKWIQTFQATYFLSC